MHKELLFLPLFILCSGSVVAQEQPASVAQSDSSRNSERAIRRQIAEDVLPDPPVLTEVFRDDFQNDSRANYQTVGDVAWNPGLMLIENKGSITRAFEGSPWVKFELDLGRNQDAPNLSDANLDIHFRIDEANDCLVQIRETTDNSERRVVCSLIELHETHGDREEVMVKTSSPRNDVPEQLTIEYRFGDVRVESDQDGLWLQGYVEKEDAAVSGIRIAPNDQDAVVRLAGYSFASLDVPKLTAAQKQQLSEATESDSRSVHLYNAGNYAEAFKISDNVRRLRKSVLGQWNYDYRLSLNNLAVIQVGRGDYSAAAKLLAEARVIGRDLLGDRHPDYASTLINLSGVCRLRGDFTNAEQISLEVREILADTTGTENAEYALCLNNLGLLYNEIGDYSKAIRIHSEARAIRERLAGKKHRSYATSLNNLALAYESSGDYAEAEKLYRECVEIDKEVLGENHPDYARSLANLASCYRHMGDFHRAEGIMIEAVNIQKVALSDRHPEYASSLINLAGLYKDLKKFEKAETLYQETLDIRRRTIGEKHPRTALTLNDLSGLVQEKGEYSRAEKMLIQSREIWEGLSSNQHPQYAVSTSNLSSLYRVVGEYDRAKALVQEAIEIQKKALSSTHPAYITSLNNLTDLYCITGDWTRARDLADEAIAASLAAARNILPVMSDAQALRWYSKHRPKRSLRLHTVRRDPLQDTRHTYNTVWDCSALVTRLRMTAPMTSDASTEAKQVAASLRDTRIRLAKLASAMPPPSRITAYRQQFNLATYAKEQLEKKLAEVNPATKRVMKIRDAKLDDLLKILPPKTALLDYSLSLDWDDYEKQIEWEIESGKFETRTVMDSRPRLVYDLFVIRSDRDDPVVWIQLGSAAPIDAAVQEWRSHFTDSGKARGLGEKSVSTDGKTSTAPPHRLRELIWDKAEPFIKDCANIVILPDATLNQLPWGALAGRQPGRYLIEDYSISMANYGQQLYGLLTERPVTAEKLLLAGGLDFDQRKTDFDLTNSPQQTLPVDQNRPQQPQASKDLWPALPGTKKEVRSIKGFWKNLGPVTTLTGAAAIESEMTQQLSRARFAHLATHGFFAAPNEKNAYRFDLRKQSVSDAQVEQGFLGTLVSRNPLLLSGLVVSGANQPMVRDELGIPTGDDGILTAEEIVGLDLRNLDLITLSACETGLGDVANGEGVFGLQRAFHQAGARSVIASLWKVDDQATQALMVEFYKNLWNKKMSKVEALRQAQLTMLNSYDKETGSLRGFGDKSVTVAGTNKDASERLNPRYWAAFQLSGDWR